MHKNLDYEVNGFLELTFDQKQHIHWLSSLFGTAVFHRYASFVGTSFTFEFKLIYFSIFGLVFSDQCCTACEHISSYVT